MTLSQFSASGSQIQLALNFAPVAGTSLTLVKITDLVPIEGAFSNLTQGQVVKLAYNGVVYAFFANYYGGDGNDLVLQWTNTRLIAWGSNYSGQLGINNNNFNNSAPVAVDATGVLANKSVMMVSAGDDDLSAEVGHSLALCADGTLAAWGCNTYGQLGNNSTSDSNIPVAVYRGGALAGKTAVLVASGANHNLALCDDGTLVAWGNNKYGQLGNGSTTNSFVPVRVITTGVLAGKRIAAIAAGAYFSMALCTDGTLATWGENYSGQLGNGSHTTSPLNAGVPVPVQVNRAGVLSGKKVIAIAAGYIHALALCADGSIAAWGNGQDGQLGIGTYTNVDQPVWVNRTGALAGKTVVGIAAGKEHSLALCADGTVVAWGNNATNQLGNNTVPSTGSVTMSPVPVPVLTTSGALAGKTIGRVLAAREHNLAFASDGILAAWGNASNGRLGNGGTSGSYATAVPVNTSLLKAGERIPVAFTGPMATHNFALIATPPAADAATLAATAISFTGATLNGSVNPNNNAASVRRHPAPLQPAPA
jgi:alpha-tubulin suppressor-like RCC1 family protein